MRPLAGSINNPQLRSSMPLAEFKKVSKRYGSIQAVDEVSLTIAPSETLGLVGESGCGKTTLGKLLMNLTKPSEGEIFFLGHNYHNLNEKEMRELRPHLQMIFQDPYSSLNPRMTAGEIIAEPLLIYKKCGKKEVEHLLTAVGLPLDAARKYPHEFSGGQRQRIGIARAIASNPKLIVCDEPVSALDVSVQAHIILLLKELQRHLHLSYLFISHNLSVVRYISDRIAVMYLGKLVEIGDADDVALSPLHPYTQALIAAVPTLDCSSRKKLLLKSEIHHETNSRGCPFASRCPHAKEICFAKKPILKQVGEKQAVACHLHY
jgi:oligopeptide/dipeptide ABC transporter ATP-binding protein